MSVYRCSDCGLEDSPESFKPDDDQGQSDLECPECGSLDVHEL